MLKYAIMRCHESGRLVNICVIDSVNAPSNHYIKSEVLVLYTDRNGLTESVKPVWVDSKQVILVNPDSRTKDFIRRKNIKPFQVRRSGDVC